MMKHRILAAVLALMLLFSAACAEIYLPDYISVDDIGEPLRYLQDLLGVTEIDYYYQEPFCGELTLEALGEFQYQYGLEVTYEFDSMTLYTLLNLPVQDEYSDPLVWIPMHGGTKYHAYYDCSNMIYAQQMPESCAYAMGYDYCLRCW